MAAFKPWSKVQMHVQDLDHDAKRLEIRTQLEEKLEELVCIHGSWFSCFYCIDRSWKFCNGLAGRSSVQIWGKHLAEHCRAEYSKVPNLILWILAESAIVACDIPEGYIAMYATLASRDVDCCLIPESPFYLKGPDGLFDYIEKRLKENGHMVIVIAECAGQQIKGVGGVEYA